MRRLLFPALLAVLAGCKPSGPAEYRRTGTVQFDGKPVPMGKIFFEPDVSAGGSGPTGYADIVDGRYTTAGGKDARGGPTIVRVTGYSNENPDKISGFGQPLFAEFETKLNLPEKASEHDIEVPASAAKGLPKKSVPLDP